VRARIYRCKSNSESQRARAFVHGKHDFPERNKNNRPSIYDVTPVSLSHSSTKVLICDIDATRISFFHLPAELKRLLTQFKFASMPIPAFGGEFLMSPGSVGIAIASSAHI
jgi:hypothetical protein